MEEVLARARERLEQASAGAVDPSQTRAAFERARAQMEALTQLGAELETMLANQLIRRLGELEQEIEAERLARVEDLGLLVDLIAGGWRGVDERLARMEESLNGREAIVYRIERDSA
jgi:hypothetical protein